MTDEERLLIELPEALVGQRVVVRPYRPGDGPALFEAVQESMNELLPWMAWAPAHRQVADSEAIVRRSSAKWALREDLLVGIWERETGRYLGSSGLNRIDWNVGSFEVGYWLRSSATGHGYATETVRLLTDLAFESLNANRVFLRVASTNLRSLAIPIRLGFVLEGVMRNAHKDADGQLLDMHVFRLLPDEWEELRATEAWT